MSKYKMSDGLYVEKSVIDRRVRKAKEQKLAMHLEEHGYFFCTTCNNNEDKPIDVAHVISVDECQKTGKSELAWNLTNMIVEGRECHKKRDKLFISKV